MSDNAALAAPAARVAPRSPTAALRGALPVLGVVAGILVLWEGGKLLLRIPDSRLPHISDVVGAFFVRTQGGQGPILLGTMLSNAAATFGVALSGFLLGGLLGFVLALLFS